MVTRGMIIAELIEGLPIELVRGSVATVIEAIVEDSRCAAPGCLFAARAGHETVVFEKNDRPGGLLRYGIPDFKLGKAVIDRRLDQLRAEGVQFQNGVAVGEDISPRYLRKMFDATLLAIGAEEPRDLPVPGRRQNLGTHGAG